MSFQKRVFTQKTYGAQLYKWSPVPTEKLSNQTNKRPFYCTAVAGSQGQDWITTYVYDLIVVNSKQEKSAYVECDYVE